MATGTKRPCSESEGGPTAKKQALIIPTLDVGPVASEEDLDIKVLMVQNRKLSQRLRERNGYHNNMERRVELLEQKQDNHSRVVVALRRMLSILRDQLTALLVPSGNEDSIVSELTNEILAEVASTPESLERVFECVGVSVGRLGDLAMREGVGPWADEDKSALFEERQKKMLSLIKDIQKRDKERGCHDDDITILEGKVEELGTALADARFDLFKSQSRCEQLELQLQHTMEELTQRPSVVVGTEEKVPEDRNMESPEAKSVEEGTSEETDKLQCELTELRALSESRLTEISELTREVSSLKREREKMVEEASKPPDKEMLVESVPYKSLQAQYTIAVQEITQLKNCFEEAKQLLSSAKQQHFLCLEEIRSEELKYQAVVRDEMAQLENALGTTRRDYELLKVDFERLIASNEQAGPRAKELQVTVDSMQKALQQSKAEITRYKNRAHKAEQELAKNQETKVTETTHPEGQSSSVPEPVDKPSDLSIQIKKLKDEKSALEVELNSLKASSSGEVKERAELVANERKYRTQVDDLRKKFEEYRKDYEKRKEHIRDEAGRKVKALTEDNRHLQKDLNAKKHEAQALVSDMECTAQAFEEMQEQNIRLLQQLTEKDEANFKLMSERIKSNSVQKLLVQERSLFQSQLSSHMNEKQRLSDLIVAVQDRERNTELSVQSMEKELTVKSQAVELHKRKALDSVQLSHESQLSLQEGLKEVEGVKNTVQSKQDEIDSVNQTNRRLQEEMGSLKRKLEKYKSREWATSSDEVLLEEIRTYKVKLNCPCCSTRKKDTVLTKCFHVFCSECIRSRYDSRLRKCPKCGAAFGANDFHKIYLS